jgi:hypothetical protein
MNAASEKQVEYCKDLFRKTKIYYNCCETDKKLRDEVLKRTGYDLDNLSHDEARQIITKLSQSRKTPAQRKAEWNKWR